MMNHNVFQSSELDRLTHDPSLSQSEHPTMLTNEVSIFREKARAIFLEKNYPLAIKYYTLSIEMIVHPSSNKSTNLTPSNVESSISLLTSSNSDPIHPQTNPHTLMSTRSPPGSSPLHKGVYKDAKFTSPDSDHLPFLLVNRAICFNKLGDWQRALDDCNEAIKFGGNDLKAYYNRACAYENAQMLREAYSDAQMLISLGSQNANNMKLFTRIQNAYIMSEYNSAIDVLKNERVSNSELFENLKKLELSLDQKIELLLEKNTLEILHNLILNNDNIQIRSLLFNLIHYILFRQNSEESQEHQKISQQIKSSFVSILPISRLLNEFNEIVSLCEKNDVSPAQISLANNLITIIGLYTHISHENVLYALHTALRTSQSFTSSSLTSLHIILKNTDIEISNKPRAVTNTIKLLTHDMLNTMLNHPYYNEALNCLILLIKYLYATEKENNNGEVNMEQLLDALLSHLLQSNSNRHLLMGLFGLKAVYLIDKNTFLDYISPSLLNTLKRFTITSLNDIPSLQYYSAELLSFCMDSAQHRVTLLNSDIVHLCKVVSDQPITVKLHTISLIIKIAMHLENSRHHILEMINFIQHFEEALSYIQNSNVQWDDLIDPIVNFFKFLSLHAQYKNNFYQRPIHGYFTILNHLARKTFSTSIPASHTLLCGIFYLISSSYQMFEYTEQRRIENDHFLYQIHQPIDLEYIESQFPYREKIYYDYNYGDQKFCFAIKNYFLESPFFSHIQFFINHTQNIPTQTYAIISACIRLFGENLDHRSIINSQGALYILLQCVENLKNTMLELKDTRQAIAQLCISSNIPNLPSKHQQDVLFHLLALIRDPDEFLQYEAALALNNLLSKYNEMISKVWYSDGWHLFRNLITSDNFLVRSVCLQGWCNLSYLDEAKNHLFSNLSKVLEQSDIQATLSHILETSNLATQRAAAGTIANFMMDERLTEFVYAFPEFSKVKICWETTEDTLLLDQLYLVLNSALKCQTIETKDKAIIKSILSQKLSKISKNVLEKN